MSLNTTLSRCICDECEEPVQYVYADFVAGEQKVMPCGHHAAIRFEPDHDA